jgi:hypothetical protein
MKQTWFIVAVLLGVGSARSASGASFSDNAIRYVVLGENGTASVRIVTDSTECPEIEVDGRRKQMTVRAKAATLPQRPTSSKPELSKPSAFPVTICEASVARSASRAEVGGIQLPLARHPINRIVVIGDTGCRLKAGDDAYQSCNDPKAYPFALIAARAAAWKPDLVVHVGDYLYRENPCPEGMEGCSGSPWGYGWDAWSADFFRPAAPLLAIAPLLLVRGNHENCARAGQGWYRFLDPRPLVPGHDCNDAVNDFTGDYSEPYAVPLGARDQIVVMDLAIAGAAPLGADDPRLTQFRSAYAQLASLAAHKDMTFMATHKPPLAFAAVTQGGNVKLLPGNQAIQSAFVSENPRMFPAGVDVLLSGHIHLWQQVGFGDAYPSQFVTGFSGTAEDLVPIPETLPPGSTPAAGAIVKSFSSWVNGFGYMTLERRGSRRWTAEVWNVSGQIVNRCTIDGRRSRCDVGQVHALPSKSGD